MEVTAKVDLELDLQIDGTHEGPRDPLWQQKLWVSHACWFAVDEILIGDQSADANFAKLCFPIDIPYFKMRKGKLVASADLAGLGLGSFDDDVDDDDDDTGDDSDDIFSHESDPSPTTGSEDIFAHGSDGTSAPATSSDSAPTDIFTPERDLAASGSTDATTPETDILASGTEITPPETDSQVSQTDEFSSAPDEGLSGLSLLSDPTSTTTEDSFSVPDLSNSFQSPTDPALSPLPEFTTAPETSPAPEPALALSGSESLPDSTPLPDTSSPDTQLAMDTFLTPDSSTAPTELDSSTDAGTSSASESGFSTLPERNAMPDSEHAPQYDAITFLPDATTSPFFNNEDRSLDSLETGDDATLPVPQGDENLFASNPSTDTDPTNTAGNLPELGEGSTFNEPPSALTSTSTFTSSPAYDLFLPTADANANANEDTISAAKPKPKQKQKNKPRG